VYFIYGIRYLMVLVKVISVIMTECTVSYREVCYIVNRLGTHFSVLYRPNSWQLPIISLNIYSSCLCFIHYITIMTQKKLLCVIQFQFLYVHFSTHYNIPSVIGTHWNMLLARCKHAPRTCIFVARMFLTHSQKRICLYPLPHKYMPEMLLKLP
jgi:hypothetical protein